MTEKPAGHGVSDLLKWQMKRNLKRLLRNWMVQWLKEERSEYRKRKKKVKEPDAVIILSVAMTVITTIMPAVIIRTGISIEIVKGQHKSCSLFMFIDQGLAYIGTSFTSI